LSFYELDPVCEPFAGENRRESHKSKINHAIDIGLDITSYSNWWREVKEKRDER
jgi:hypothetical protein